MCILLYSIPSGAVVLLCFLAILGYAYFWFGTIWEIANYQFEGKYTRAFWLFFTIISGFLGMILYYLIGRSSRLQKLIV